MSRSTLISKSFGIVALVGVAVCSAIAQEASADKAQTSLERPIWSVGDSWLVESVTDPIQGRSNQPPGTLPVLQWKFVVAGEEKIAGADCFRIDVACVSGGAPTKATLWCAKDTLFLRQVETWVYVGGAPHAIIESFAAGSKSVNAPVLPSVNALPLDFPAFPQAGRKALSGEESFLFKSKPAAAGAKADDLVAFATNVKQKIGAPSAESMKALGPNGSKSIKQPVQVELESPGRSVTQIWQSGRPWPEYSDNGRTQSRLVSVEPAAK